jgi:hypothetical protein
LQDRIRFVSETIGSLSIRKQNPTIERTLHAPADNSPLNHFCDRRFRLYYDLSSRENLRRRHKHARDQKTNGDITGNLHGVRSAQRSAHGTSLL